MSILTWITRLIHRNPPRQIEPSEPTNDSTATTTLSNPDSAPVWCVAANVVMERGYGPGGAETLRGTKHFAPGAKVFVYNFFWGVGGETVTVIGRHRKSHRYIRLSMPAKHLANWRAELVYSPSIAKQVRDSSEFGPLPPESENARRRAEQIAAFYIEQGAQSQPFLTRPPTTQLNRKPQVPPQP